MLLLAAKFYLFIYLFSKSRDPLRVELKDNTLDFTEAPLRLNGGADGQI